MSGAQLDDYWRQKAREAEASRRLRERVRGYLETAAALPAQKRRTLFGDRWAADLLRHIDDWERELLDDGQQ